MDIKFGSDESGEISLPKSISLGNLLKLGRDIAELKGIELYFPGGRSVEFNLYEMSDRVDVEVGRGNFSIHDYSGDYFNLTTVLTQSDFGAKMVRGKVNGDAMEFGLVTYSASVNGMKIVVHVLDLNFRPDEEE